MKSAIKVSLFNVGFVAISTLYYLEIILIDKSIRYGLAFGIARVILLFVAFVYFWVLAKEIPYLNRLKEKINQYPSTRNRGGYVIVLTITIIHLVILYFVAVGLNNYLLRVSGQLTIGVIKDCRQGRRGDYCLYEYVVQKKVYQVQISNRPKKYEEQDSINVLYYPTLPVISVVKE